MKESKTKEILIETAKLLSMQSESCKVYQNGFTIRNTHKYLDIYVNSSLNLNSHFEKILKESSRKTEASGEAEKISWLAVNRRSILLHDLV